MKKRECAFLLLLLLPLGCSTGSTGSVGSSGPQNQILDVTGNWLIESVSVYASTSFPTSGLLLTGSLVSIGAQGNVTGTLDFSYFGPATACGRSQTLTFTGSVNADRNLTLTSETLQGGGVITVNMPLPSTLSTYGSGGTTSISEGACMQASMGVTGALQEPLNGTFTGVLTPGVFGTATGGTAGTGSLVLTESPIGINNVLEFDLNGTFSYTFGTCTGSVAITGIHSGISFGLNGATVSSANSIKIVGGANSIATSLQINEVALSPAPCSADPKSLATYGGTLTLQ